VALFRNLPSRRGEPRRRSALLLLALVLASLTLSYPAPATVEEQRARLPSAVECGDDPVAGVWLAHAYVAVRGRWVYNTMRLRRTAPDKLVSDFRSVYWSGGPDQSEPPECRPGVVHRRSDSTGEATVDPKSGVLTVRGTKLGVRRSLCGDGPLPERALAELSGKIDAARQELQAVMSSRFGSYPIVYRRVGCSDDEVPPPAGAVTPPPLRPSARQPQSSCGCRF